MTDQEKIADLETRLAKAEREIAEMRAMLSPRLSSASIGSVAGFTAAHTCIKSGRAPQSSGPCLACINEGMSLDTRRDNWIDEPFRFVERFGPGPNGY